MRMEQPPGSHSQWRLNTGQNTKAESKHTFFPHVHVMNFSVSIFGLPNSTVRQRIPGMIRIHSKIQVMARVSHGQLKFQWNKFSLKNSTQKCHLYIIHQWNRKEICLASRLLSPNLSIYLLQFPQPWCKPSSKNKSKVYIFWKRIRVLNTSKEEP